MTEQQFEAVLRQSLRPEIDPKETVVFAPPIRKGHTMKSILKKAVVAIAAVMLLATTAAATDFMNIKTLASAGTRGYQSESYKNMDKAMKKAGLEIEAPEEFENGYAFTRVNVEDTDAFDEYGEKRFTYKDMMIVYRHPNGKRLILCANPDLEKLPDNSRQPDQTRTIGEIQVEYRRDHYKFVPPDYQLTPEDEAMLEKPGYYLSYGSDTVQEQDNNGLSWVKDGICYHLLDSGANETADTLFAMAEELILAEE